MNKTIEWIKSETWPISPQAISRIIKKINNSGEEYPKPFHNNENELIRPNYIGEAIEYYINQLEHKNDELTKILESSKKEEETKNQIMEEIEKKMPENIEILEKKVLIIDDVEYNIIKEFFVPQIGWELDYLAYIVEYEGKKRLVCSDHGVLYMMDQDMVPNVYRYDSENFEIPRDQNWILLKIKNLENNIKDLKDASMLL